MSHPRGQAGHRAADWSVVVVLALALMLQALTPLLHRHAEPTPAARSGLHAAVHHDHPCHGGVPHAHAHPGAPGVSGSVATDGGGEDHEPPDGPHDHDCELCRLLAGVRPGLLDAGTTTLVRVCEPPLQPLTRFEARAGGLLARETPARGPPTA